MIMIDENGITLRHFELDPSVDYQGRVRDIVVGVHSSQKI
jgi:hypothetical protein